MQLTVAKHFKVLIAFSVLNAKPHVHEFCIHSWGTNTLDYHKEVLGGSYRTVTWIFQALEHIKKTTPADL